MLRSICFTTPGKLRKIEHAIVSVLFKDVFGVSVVLTHDALQTTSAFIDISDNKRLREFQPRLAADQMSNKVNVCHREKGQSFTFLSIHFSYFLQQPIQTGMPYILSGNSHISRRMLQRFSCRKPLTSMRSSFDIMPTISGKKRLN